jgi:hypothetical protein
MVEEHDDDDKGDDIPLLLLDDRPMTRNRMALLTSRR